METDAHRAIIALLRRNLTSIPYMPFSFCGPLNVGPTQTTFGSNFNLERRFTGVKLIMANYASAPQVIPAVCCAPSASLTNPVSPIDTNGRSVAWTAVTFGGAQSTVLPSAEPLDGGISYTLSDLVPVEALERVDGSPYFALMTRTLSPVSGYQAPAMADAQIALVNAIDGGRALVGYFLRADYVSGPETQNALTAESAQRGFNFPYVAGVVFQTHERCVSYGFFGDSLTQGDQTESGWGGYGRRCAVMMSNDARGVSMVDGGVPGQITRQFAGRLRALLTAGVIPHIVSLPIDSPNDYSLMPGAAQRVSQEATIFELVDRILAQGSLPVLLAGLPFGPLGVDLNGAERLISSLKVRALARHGLVVLDVPPIVCGYTPSPTRPAIVPFEYLAPDGFHYNDRLQQQIALCLQSLLSGLIE